MVVKLLIIASVFNLAYGFKAPYPGFKPCHAIDNDCMLQNAKDGLPFFVDGIPEYGIKSSDPDFYEKVDASSNNLKFFLNRITVTGLKTCKAVSVKRDVAKSTIELVTECDLKLDGEYEMEGKILIIDIAGNGKVHAELPNFVNKVKCNYIMKKGKDGKEYIKIKSFVHTYELKGKPVLVFEGLFPNNDVLRQAAKEVIENNPKEVIAEIGPEVFNTVVKRLTENFNKFFTSVPYAEIALD